MKVDGIRASSPLQGQHTHKSGKPGSPSKKAQQTAQQILQASGKTSLTREDFIAHLSTLKPPKEQGEGPHRHDPSEIAEKVFAQFDKNADGLDQTELSEAIEAGPKPPQPKRGGKGGSQEDEVDRIFGGKQEISSSEFIEKLREHAKSLSQNGGLPPNLPSPEEVVIKLDTNQDGKISRQEFSKMPKPPKAKESTDQGNQPSNDCKDSKVIKQPQETKL
jgi:Ca2+-binding EF-hand superfamily protein